MTLFRLQRPALAKSIISHLRLALILLAATAPAALAADPASAPPLASLTVVFHGLKSAAGMVMLSLVAGPEAYDGKAPATAQAGVTITAAAASVTFERLRPGAYAVRAFHDLNGDGKLNTNPFGIPTEPYAFSNNARGAMGPPKWDAAAFAVKPGDNRLTIDID